MLNGEAVETTRKMEAWLLDGGLAPPAKVALERQKTQDKVCLANQNATQLLASLQSSRTCDAWQSSVHPTQSSACMQCAVASTEQLRLLDSHMYAGVPSMLRASFNLTRRKLQLSSLFNDIIFSLAFST